MRALALSILFALALPFVAVADEHTPSTFRDTPYEPQNVVYELNYATPKDGVRALGYLRNHLRALEEFGDVAKDSHIVVVMHGYEVHAMARENADHFPKVYDTLKGLADKGVSFYLCRNSARGKGYDVDDFYDVVTVVPAGMSELGHWQMKGYATINPRLNPRMNKKDLGLD